MGLRNRWERQKDLLSVSLSLRVQPHFDSGLFRNGRFVVVASGAGAGAVLC